MLKAKKIGESRGGKTRFGRPCVFNNLDLIRFFRTFLGQMRAGAENKAGKCKLYISLLYINNINILVIYTVIRTTDPVLLPLVLTLEVSGYEINEKNEINA
jgi:hypothetical protein